MRENQARHRHTEQTDSCNSWNIDRLIGRQSGEVQQSVDVEVDGKQTQQVIGAIIYNQRCFLYMSKCVCVSSEMPQDFIKVKTRQVTERSFQCPLEVLK